MESQPLVTVFCLAYNHENYITKTLDGFVTQKTSFPFEVLIHDDCSTDQTASIIKKYSEQYPDIIKPVFQTENQYSKGIKITSTFLMPKAQGKYFAWCEGDDCWTDCNKLQKQIDFLEANPNYSCCYHKVLMKNLYNGNEVYMPLIQSPREFTLEEIVKGGAIFHLSSAVFRSDLYRKKPECFVAKGFGDIQLYMYGAICGKCYVFNDVMSMYNHGTPGSWTERVAKNKEKNLEHERQLLSMLNRTNEYYEYQYDSALQHAIKRAEFNILALSGCKKDIMRPEFRAFYIQRRREKIFRFVQKRFPSLIRIKNKLKGI